MSSKLTSKERLYNFYLFTLQDDKASSLKLQARVDELLSTLQSLNEEKMVFTFLPSSIFVPR